MLESSNLVETTDCAKKLIESIKETRLVLWIGNPSAKAGQKLETQERRKFNIDLDKSYDSIENEEF